MFPDSVLAPKLCSNAISDIGLGHGKSPCFSQSIAFRSADVDGLNSVLMVLYIDFFQV